MYRRGNVCAVWRNAHGFNPQIRRYRRAYLCGDYLSLDFCHQPRWRSQIGGRTVEVEGY